MAIIKDADKTYSTLLKVYNSVENTYEGKLEDEEFIKKLCSKIFPSDGSEVSEHDLKQFNNIVAKIATTVSEPDVQQMIKYFGDTENVPFNTQMVKYRKPVPKHVKFAWASVGSAVSLKRVATGKDEFIHLDHAQTAMEYNPLSNNETQVEDFRALVNDVAEARVQLIYNTIVALIEKGASSGGEIPTKQCISKGNVTIAEFDGVANMVGLRTNSRPIFLAPRPLINSFAAKKASAVSTQLPDALKSQFYNYEVTNLGSADAIAIMNEYTTELGDDTHFPIDTGYVLGSASGKKPFKIALAGGITTKTEEDKEYGRIKLFVRQKLGIDFLYAGNIGRIEDTSVVSL